jgi:2-iminobutanoate/2-iminopropanoate deaminase
MKQKLLSIALLLVFSSQCSEQMKSKNNMAQVTAIQAHDAPQAIGPYSQAIKVSSAQTILFISGQLPLVPETGVLVTDPAEATKQCMNNAGAILKEAGMDFSNVVDVTILLKNMTDFGAVNGAYAAFFNEPYPARATFQVAGLPKDAVIEIKMIAVK